MGKKRDKKIYIPPPHEHLQNHDPRHQYHRFQPKKCGVLINGRHDGLLAELGQHSMTMINN